LKAKIKPAIHIHEWFTRILLLSTLLLKGLVRLAAKWLQTARFYPHPGLSLQGRGRNKVPALSLQGRGSGCPGWLKQFCDRPAFGGEIDGPVGGCLDGDSTIDAEFFIDRRCIVFDGIG